ncbi:MAG: hypothetical protein A4E35_01932 [Methanoregula sp. PtaU1.Bin051]|nr:MAG: hypothetical protein A4E35_01932 [Methanoregula sp. PtaU1.Bin051]
MGTHPEMVDKLSLLMEESGEKQRWITVEEFRGYFQLEKNTSPAIAGILRRMYRNPTFGCPYRVTRIEICKENAPPYRVFRRYLVQARSPRTSGSRPEPQAPAHVSGNLVKLRNP